MSQCLSVFIALVFVFFPISADTRPGDVDPGVDEGRRLIADGDPEGAIAALDRAVARLSQSPARKRELAKVYLFLGIAQVDLGRDEDARASFRLALENDPAFEVESGELPGKARRLLHEEHLSKQRARKGSIWPYLLAGSGVVGSAAVGLGKSSSGSSGYVPKPLSTCLAVDQPIGYMNATTMRFTIQLDAQASIVLDFGDGASHAATVSLKNLTAASWPTCPVPQAPFSSNTSLNAYSDVVNHVYTREGDYRVTATIDPGDGRSKTDSLAVRILSLTGQWYVSSIGDPSSGVYFLSQDGFTISGYCSSCRSGYSGEIRATFMALSSAANSDCGHQIQWTQGATTVTGTICSDLIKLPGMSLYKR